MFNCAHLLSQIYSLDGAILQSINIFVKLLVTKKILVIQYFEIMTNLRF